MPCFHPIEAWQHHEGGSLIFHDPHSPAFRYLKIACGQCLGCRLEKSRIWAVRAMHEASLYKDNCFLTLTYDDAHLPKYGNLQIRDFQLFMKRLRKALSPLKIRNFYCGEYGDVWNRPHYHAILFNWFPPDCVPLKIAKSGCQVFSSPFLNKLWPFGFCVVGDCSFESCAYIARYTLKKQKDPAAYQKIDPFTGEVIMLKKPFVHMSNRSGIGYKWLDMYAPEVKAHKGKVFENGHFFKIPRYYAEKFGDEKSSFYDPEFAQWIKQHNEEMAREYQKSIDNTPERLKVRENLLKSRWKNHTRATE